jgi:endonuclease-8
MAEGPLVHRIARGLARVLEGRAAGVEFAGDRLAEEQKELTGRVVERVEARGKQFRFHFEGGRLLLVHLLMWGSWRTYRRGAEWDKDPNKARVVLRTETHECVAFSAPVVQVMGVHELQESKWGGLGPDPLCEDWDEQEFRRRLRAARDHEIGEVIMDQRVIAGVGNMLRVEILWRCGIHPERKVREMNGNEIDCLLDWTIELMRRWLNRGGRAKPWLKIYRKSKQPCPRCGAMIAFSRQAGRVTYHCPECQPRKGGRPPGRTQNLFLP